MLKKLKPYAKAVAGFVVPLGTQLVVQLGFSTDLTVGEILGMIATSLASGGAVYRVRNSS